MTAALVRDTLPAGQVLDWRTSDHYRTPRKCCRYCGLLTPLRDEDGRPAHKVCAEQDRQRDRNLT